MDDCGILPNTGSLTGDYNNHLTDFVSATGFGYSSLSPTQALIGTPAGNQVVVERSATASILGTSTTALTPPAASEDSGIKGLDYVYQLGFGLFKSGKLLPLQYMGGLVVELTVEDDNLLVRQDSFRVLASGTTVGVNAWETSKIKLSNIEFHSSLLRFDEKYDLGIAEALQQTGLRIPFTSYSVVRNVISPSGQYTLTVSERASSVQSVYGVFRPISAVNNVYRKMDGIEFWPRLDISDYQRHTATQNYPDNPVRLNSSASEAFAETIKCFQGLDRPWERSLSSGNAGCHDMINSTTYGNSKLVVSLRVLTMLLIIILLAEQLLSLTSDTLTHYTWEHCLVVLFVIEGLLLIAKSMVCCRAEVKDSNSCSELIHQFIQMFLLVSILLQWL